VLLNESTVLSRRDEHIVVTGLDDVHRFFSPMPWVLCRDRQEGSGLPLCTLQKSRITHQRRGMLSTFVATPMVDRYVCLAADR
jgi:hypothetical protein